MRRSRSPESCSPELVGLLHWFKPNFFFYKDATSACTRLRAQMRYPAWLAALSSNKCKCWYPARESGITCVEQGCSLQGKRGHFSRCLSCCSCVCTDRRREGRLSRARSLSVSAVDVLRLAIGREETAVWTALQHTAALLEQRFAGQTGLVLLLCADRSSGTGP